MDDRWKCPKCAGDDRYTIEKVLVADYTSANAMNPFTLTAHYGETGETGFLGAKMERAVVRSRATVCAACGYTDLYALDLPVLERLAQERHGGVRRRRG